MFFIKEKKYKKILFLTILSLFIINFFLLCNNKIMGMNRNDFTTASSSSYSYKLKLHPNYKTITSDHLNNIRQENQEQELLFSDLKNIKNIRLDKILNINSLEELKDKYSKIQVIYSLKLELLQYLHPTLSPISPYPLHNKQYSETHEINLSSLKTEIIDGVSTLILPDIVNNYQKERKIFNFIYKFDMGGDITSEIDPAYNNYDNLFMILLNSLNIKEEYNSRSEQKIYLDLFLRTFSFVEDKTHAFYFEFILEEINFQ
nr:hypothetical protein [Candidatus Phytoplasma sacchari]KAB8121914.1 hypothetical protein F2B49_02000 [Candidatus Phytoplasma sacchari]